MQHLHLTTIGQISLTREILVNGSCLLQGIWTFSRFISSLYRSFTTSAITTSGVVCYNNLTLSGSVSICVSVYLRTDKDSYFIGSGVWAFI